MKKPILEYNFNKENIRQKPCKDCKYAINGDYDKNNKNCICEKLKNYRKGV